VAHPSDPDLLVLHSLRLKGFADTDAVAKMSSLDVDGAAERLARFEARQYTRHRTGRVSGWTLTSLGRSEGERQLAAELDAVAGRGPVTDAYRGFLTHNADMLQICTEWQVRDADGTQDINDHSDEAYDREVVARLEALDAAVGPVCVELAGTLGRFSNYRDRFSGALDRVRAGEPDWFTKPTIDSYHTVWFELHENLLATLGIERGSEMHHLEAI